ncbi:SPW repeat protein [Amycolatopsis sp. FDAARGOS 1241]|uniref:SPW repeat domain-containing protein n=1 Tax=Amycolatopsis sp. FDAARGOS 1241 TaxID=2778070 RepID=UPI0019501886|nr:SPW repeat protein [Amycolatopsis sp. FDAARGOS 1241]QRP49231.1 SPW repeat protein [Amycolatopsis sp. FDAARGOS 1241]
MSTPTERSGARGAVGALVGAAAGLAVLAGLYLIIGPWLARFGGAAELAVSNTVTGLAIIVLAAVRARDPRPQALTWVLPVLGLWAAISPLVLRYGDETAPSAGALAGNVIAGVVVLAAGVALLLKRPANR